VYDLSSGAISDDLKGPQSIFQGHGVIISYCLFWHL